jgi:hypothetical protein
MNIYYLFFVLARSHASSKDDAFNKSIHDYKAQKFFLSGLKASRKNL